MRSVALEAGKLNGQPMDALLRRFERTAGYRAGFIEMARKAQLLKPREG